MMRLNLKVLLLVLCAIVILITLSLWAKCGDPLIGKHLYSQGWNGKKSHSLQRLQEQDDSYVGEPADRGNNDLQGYEEIDCHINGEYSVNCRKEGEEIYVPFSFLHKYFEVYGKLATYDGYERFEWSHSYSKVYIPKGKYDPRGVFMYFENYNVEVRDRVKCVSAIDGVPVSTQWESQGYYYPTQIAQFGLAHYSKNLTEPEPRRMTLEDGNRVLAQWQTQHSSSFSRVLDPSLDSYVLKFNSAEAVSPSGVSLKLDHVLDFVLSLDLKMKGNGSFTVTLQSREKREVFHLHYICSDLLISAEDRHVYHGMGCRGEWRHLTRDLLVDLQKGFLHMGRKRRPLSRSKIKVTGFTIRGSGFLDNLTLSSSEHMAQFYDAARWFVSRQDIGGGWPVPVRRRGATAKAADLVPDWYSAMAQGHAASVLARAHHHSGASDPRYLEAALRGLGPFHTLSEHGGVLAKFMGIHPWYEEYPTQPPSFVLNGFIYALLGLYDLKTVAPPGSAGAEEAGKLWSQGMASLKALLMLFDTGSGSVYDLRHFTVGQAPNLARWDYHATHVNQLLLLATIDPDPILSKTAERWVGYMSGKRASHN
ncbi:D-glucuronyl C5-epimerase B [Ischnura elegans]|uniref:D-glucuronyl C5-epimerase B n=1 Tax=Ischnura elegans TaxID=197161 RepID=UPI001ED87E47|nr:D-glucuronyl C5-epimerase B [Ischnura elegans]